MRKRLPTIILAIIFLIGAGIFAYPTVSEHWNRLHQSRAIATYQEAVDDMTEEDYAVAWEAAEAYNAEIEENTFNHDAFSQEEENLRGTEYWSVLNIGGSGVMGYIYIPKGNIRLPIYHGTSDAVLQVGAGHMYGTNLPIGGEGTHCVIAGHRGLPSARLFTDIDQLEIGDVFYIHVLDRLLTYEVDQISDMVDKDDTDTLTDLMQQVEGEDYVTLFTCTPYGINSHRLLVRGHRIENPEETALTDSAPEDSVPVVPFVAAALILLLVLILILVRHFRKKQENKK